MVFDTNILIYAANEDSEFHEPCRDYLNRCRQNPFPVFLTWSICYEFLRVSTHRSVFRSPWSSQQAWDFVVKLLESQGFKMLQSTDLHSAVLAQTLSELPEIHGNMIHELHIVVLMREHGISRICTRDTKFHRFPFVEVVDPLR